MNSASESAPFTVLLVEDNADVRKVFRLIFASQGFAVVECGTIEEAKSQMTEQGLPHAALVDVDLNGEDGMTLGGWIREQQNGNQVLLATLTGHDGVSHQKRSEQAGFDFHFVKPVKMLEVCNLLKDKLQNR